MTTKPTTCGHEPHYAKGLCRKCYDATPAQKEHYKEYYRKYKQRPNVKEKGRKAQRRFRRKHPEIQTEYNIRAAIKKLTKEMEKYPWLSPEGKNAMILDGDVLKMELKKRNVV